MNTVRTAIYARISTGDQNSRTQLQELKRYTQRRRFRVTHTLVDRESDARPDRPQLQELMELTWKRKVDVVLVWKFDRFARSTRQLLAVLESSANWQWTSSLTPILHREHRHLDPDRQGALHDRLGDR